MCVCVHAGGKARGLGGLLHFWGVTAKHKRNENYWSKERYQVRKNKNRLMFVNGNAF